MKVKAYVQFEVVLIRVSITRELNRYAWLSMRLSFSSTAAGSSLYIGRLAPSSSQSPGRLIRVSGSDSQLFLPYTTSSTIMTVVTAGLKPYPGLKPIFGPPSSSLAPGFGR